MGAVLSLYEDSLCSNAAPVRLPALPRLLYVTHGIAKIDGRAIGAGEAWSGEDVATLAPGECGVTLWRFEFAPAGGDRRISAYGVASTSKLSADCVALAPGALLLRGDSVAFPPGACAYLHRHQGPGIRCLVEGGIRIDSHGHSTSYGPGGAWFESGPDPVFAQASHGGPSRFVRVMILPLSLHGKSSIVYLNPADGEKPKSQQYRIFADMPITP
ncbi:MAG: hypothetical protein HY056_11170 [Proteobacteria bacterium]|nr:hypothetical protein [Pseudomonadota bacterium]